MSLKDQVNKIERQLSTFKVLGPESIEYFSKFTMSDPTKELATRIAHIEKHLKDFRIMGGAGATVQGSMQHGYCVTCENAGANSDSSSDGGPTTPITGACCVDVDCFVITETDCGAIGGVYRGDDVSCDDVSCGTGACCCTFDDGQIQCGDDVTEVDCIVCCPVCDYFGTGSVCDPALCGGGACCFNDVCTLYSDEESCNAVGGDYKGDGTTCADEDICPVGACCIGTCFENYSQYNCETLSGGIYQEDTSTCSPNPCPGACCSGDMEFPCDELNESDCTDDGGLFKGAGTHCDDIPDPCGGCPEITLMCDSIHASKSKCGVNAYDGSDPVYLTENTTYSEHCTISCSNHCNHTCSASDDGDASSTSASYDPVTCVNSGTSCSVTVTLTNCDGGTTVFGAGCSISNSFLTSTTATSKDWLRFFVSPGCTACGSISCAHDPLPSGPSYSGLYNCPDNDCTYTKNTTLSDEYTTSMLITNTEDVLPGYFGNFGCDENEEIGFRTEGQNCTCFASRELSENEHSYEINRFKYKFTFFPSTTNFTINWNEHTEPDAGGPSDNPMSELILAGATESSEYEVIEPADNGTISIADVTCTPA